MVPDFLLISQLHNPTGMNEIQWKASLSFEFAPFPELLVGGTIAPLVPCTGGKPHSTASTQL